MRKMRQGVDLTYRCGCVRHAVLDVLVSQRIDEMEFAKNQALLEFCKRCKKKGLFMNGGDLVQRHEAQKVKMSATAYLKALLTDGVADQRPDIKLLAEEALEDAQAINSTEFWLEQKTRTVRDFLNDTTWRRKPGRITAMKGECRTEAT